MVALNLESALQAFQILLTIGAGTGLIFLLRRSWCRINAYTELTGMIASFTIALYFESFHKRLRFTPLKTHHQLLRSIGIITIAWVVITLVTRPTNQRKLRQF
ncbi:MAG: Na+:solute symporter, partial [Cytophagales bacterium]|nr:Na+:solute symporter [Cytophagales bacterium]